jgi:hypothetical protein
MQAKAAKGGPLLGGGIKKSMFSTWLPVVGFDG